MKLVILIPFFLKFPLPLQSVVFVHDFLSPAQNSNTAEMATPGVCMKIINARHNKDGLGTLSNPENFLNQDYQLLKQYCNINRVRYVDDMFPPDTRSIGKDILSPSDLAAVKWERPSVSVLVAEKMWFHHTKCDG